MPKLTNEEIEALQKSDPAAFDMDAEEEQQETQADAADELDEVDETEQAEQPRDEQGRFAAKDAGEEQEVEPEPEVVAEAAPPQQSKPNMIPEPRLAEVVAERNTEREKREAAERRAQELEAKLAEATKQPERDFAAEKSALDDQYDDGEIDFKTHQKLRDEIIVAEIRAGIAADQERERQAAAQRKAEEQKQTVQEQYDAARVRYFTDEGNQQLANSRAKEAAFRAAIEEVFEAGTAKTYDEVFEQAGAIVRRDMGIGQPQKADPHQSRKASDAAAASAASNTPPSVRGGVGNRASAGQALDVSKMRPGKFSSLPKDQQEALLGGEGAL